MAKYGAIRSMRLYEQIVDRIERQILDGELQMGDRLPSERELMHSFQVGRTAVREAIKVLRDRGLLDVHPGRGTFVRNGMSQAVRDSLGLFMKLDQAEDYGNLLQVRELLEPEIAALAASQARPENILAMQQAISAMDASLDNAETFVEADLRFHLALAEATQNPLVGLLMDPIIGLLREQRMRVFQVKNGPKHGQRHHKQILKAIRDSDPEAARAAMRVHLEQVGEDSAASFKTLHPSSNEV